MKTISRTWLHCHKPQVNSDKVYLVDLSTQDGAHFVRFAYGRRGSSLQVGWKAQNVSSAQAQRVAERLIAQKTAKGYERTDESWHVALPELPQTQTPTPQEKRLASVPTAPVQRPPVSALKLVAQKPKKLTKAQIEAEAISARLFEIGVGGDERAAAEAVRLSAKLRQLERA